MADLTLGINYSSTLLISTFTLAILLFLDKAASRYKTYWIVAIALMTVASLSVWFYIDNIPYYSEIQSKYEIPPNQFLVISDPINFLFTSYLKAAIPVLILLGWFPPKQYSLLKRCLIALSSTSCALILGFLINDKSENYINDYVTRSHEFRQEKRKEQARINNPHPEWGIRRQPDIEKGPQTEGEWRWLGYTTSWEAPRSKPGMKLRSLNLAGHRMDPEKKLMALEMLKFAKDLETLRLERMFNDEQIKYVLPLTSLKRLELIHTQITDSGFSELKNLENLVALEINKAPITDNSLFVIPEFKSLTYFRYHSINFTSDGWKLFHLKYDLDWERSFQSVRKRSKEESERRKKASHERKAKQKADYPNEYHKNQERYRKRIEELENKVLKNIEQVKT